MIVHFSAHISKWELVCKFGVIFHIFIISCLCSRFHVRNQWFFYSVITFSYTKCFVHTYTVDVVFTLSYWNEKYSIFFAGSVCDVFSKEYFVKYNASKSVAICYGKSGGRPKRTLRLDGECIRCEIFGEYRLFFYDQPWRYQKQKAHIHKFCE